MIFNKTVEYWRAPLKQDSYGQHRDWDNAVKVAVLDASVQPLESREAEADRETVVTELALYHWPVPVESGDRALIDTRWWQVEGEPEHWWSLAPGTRHQKVTVKAVRN